jgi:ELWxxDGT repeat protein
MSRWSMRWLAAGSAAAVAMAGAPVGPGLASGSGPPSAVGPVAAAAVAGKARVRLLADLRPGPASALRYSATGGFPLHVAGGSIFFEARTPGVGREPWVSDGTAATTRLVGDIVPGSGSSTLRYAASTARGTLLTFDGPFADARGSYWSTTTTGATQGDLTLLWSSPAVSTDAASFGDDALVLASDFAGSVVLWRTDGTVGPPELLRDGLILGDDLRTAGDHAFFLNAQNPLMVTDGTPGGTQRVRRWADGPYGSTVVWRMTALDHRVVFEVNAQYRIGGELWVSDGTRTGTKLLRDIRPGPADSRPYHLNLWAGKIYFVANDGRHGREVWRTDGTTAGTRRVTNLPVRVRGLQVCDGSLMILGVDRAGAALWTSDGTRGTERRVATLPGALGRAPQSLRCLPGGVAFTADDGRHGREIWTLAAGARRPTLHDIRPGPKSSRPSSLSLSGSVLFFVANDGTHGREMWTVTF